MLIEISTVPSEGNASMSYPSNNFNRSNENRQLLSTPEVDRKRLAGIRAMQSRPSGNYRVPTNVWCGYGISHTSPGSLQLDELNSNKVIKSNSLS